MDRKNLEADLIRKQNQYIRQLEEQLAVYEEKDKAQELLIEKLNQTLDLFAEELSRAKEKEETDRKE
ncbi:MAG: hypothetical protein K2N43_10215 [Lachnospiraceae bacterium]|nr:hypothetical protein [Lachnospiraceae bacterium]